MNEFKFSLEPGIKRYENRDYMDQNPIISVVVPFYNWRILWLVNRKF